jgi:3-oxocholest-4-en-26-oyl-CoA dehydrogenase alpha subunit
LGPGADRVRAEVRQFLGEYLTPDVRDRIRETGSMHDARLHKAFCERRWFVPEWPQSEGGRGMSPFEVTALREELFRAHAPNFGAQTTMISANTIRQAGTEQQRRDLLPPMISGDVVCCLGLTEPGSGSDLASVSLRAVRDGDEWVLSGEKMFNTGMEYSSYVFLLARTSAEDRPHRGLTIFLVPVDSPGLSFRPIHTLGGERTNAVSYTDVRVPDSLRLGDVGAGWRVLSVALTYERLVAYGGQLDRLWDAFAPWAGQAGADGRPRHDDLAVADALVELATACEISNLLCRRVAWLESTGAIDHVDTAVAKLYSTENYRRLSADLLGLLGPLGALREQEADSLGGGIIEHAYRFSQIMTIGGGTSEVLRNIIAGQALKLPR